MTPEEQQQLNAMRAFFERQIGNLASEGANAAALAESLAMQLKAAQARIAELTPVHPPQDNIVPIKEPA